VSETLKFSSKEVKGWLEEETSSIFIPVHERAQRLTNDMRKTLDNFADVSKMLLDNSGKEIEKRNMKTYGRARALNKLARLFIERAKQIKIPEKVTYDSFNAFVQELQKAFLVTEVDIRNWFSRISPFFILDRRKFLIVFEKAKEQLKEMTNFLTKEYVKTKTLEETFQLIDALQVLEGKLADLKEEMGKAERMRDSVEREIAETQQKMADLKNKGSIGELTQENMKIKALSTEVKQNLRHLQKPFKKLRALSLHGGGSGLTQEEIGKLGQYLEKPFEALATEEIGYPLLRLILQKLGRLMADEKLKLKSDKMRKAEQAIDNVANKNSLYNLQQKCIEAAARRKQLSTSPETAETRDDLAKLQELIETLERKKDSIELEINMTERTYNETLERIQNHKSQIEKNIFSFMDKKVIIK